MSTRVSSNGWTRGGDAMESFGARQNRRLAEKYLARAERKGVAV